MKFIKLLIITLMSIVFIGCGRDGEESSFSSFEQEQFIEVAENSINNTLGSVRELVRTNYHEVISSLSQDELDMWNTTEKQEDGGRISITYENYSYMTETRIFYNQVVINDNFYDPLIENGLTTINTYADGQINVFKEITYTNLQGETFLLKEVFNLFSDGSIGVRTIIKGININIEYNEFFSSFPIYIDLN